MLRSFQTKANHPFINFTFGGPLSAPFTRMLARLASLRQAARANYATYDPGMDQSHMIGMNVITIVLGIVIGWVTRIENNPWLDIRKRIEILLDKRMRAELLLDLGRSIKRGLDSLRIPGMITGSVFVSIGCIGGISFLFALYSSNTEVIFHSLSNGGLFFFLGMMICCITRIRKKSLPVSKAKKFESLIGTLLVAAAAIFAIAITIIGFTTSTPSNDHSTAGIVYSAFAIIAGFIIWLVTRIENNLWLDMHMRISILLDWHLSIELMLTLLKRLKPLWDKIKPW